jgi:SAM-dependent methyltransferase
MLRNLNLKNPAPLFMRTIHSTESRMDEWDSRYAAIDINVEQSERLQESEYQAIIDDELLKLLKQSKQKLKCLELACGSAPWAQYLSQNEILDVECSDYSKVIVERLRNEQGLNAFVASNNDLSAIPSNTYDLIIMAGGIYEDPDPYYVADVYREVSRILKPAGVYIQFCNRFLNFSNRVFTMKIQIKSAVIGWIDPRLWRTVRRFFGKKELKKALLFRLLPLNLIEAFAKASNMSSSSRHYIQHEAGLADMLFFLPCFKRYDLFSHETAFTNKDKIFRKWFLFLANKIRKEKNKHVCRSVALIFKKQI